MWEASISIVCAPEGQDFWTTGVYREIVPMERIVYTDSFADEKGNVVPASHCGMPGEDWPLEMSQHCIRFPLVKLGLLMKS